MEDVNVQVLIEQGKAYCEPVETDIGKFWIRPLSEGERLQLASLSMKGMRSITKSEIKAAPESSEHPMKKQQVIQKAMEDGLNKEMIMDHEKWTAAQGEARLQRIAWGLSCKGETFNTKNIKSMKGKGMKAALDKVHTAIIELTEGVEPEAEPFLGDISGEDASSAIDSQRDDSSELSSELDADPEELHGAGDSKADRSGE